MPPTSIDSARRWFLGLPQLQKTLVFGGMGMLSGWATTVSLAGWRANSPPDFGILTAAVVVPGLAFSLLVTGPLYVLYSARQSAWLQSLLLVTVLHPVAVIGYALLSAYIINQPLLPLHAYWVAGTVGACFGFLLAGCCSPTHWARESRMVLVTSIGMAIASVAVAIGMTQNLVFLLAFSPALQRFFHVALTLVTLHTTAAICLSWREWPTHDDAESIPRELQSVGESQTASIGSR
jgi:hypothetical protein